MNQVQARYATARAAFTAIEDAMRAKEAEFLQSRGRAETRIYMIDNDETFSRLNAEFAPHAECFDAGCAAAKTALREAEDALVEYALSLAPAKIRDTLRSGCKKIAFREKIIGSIMRLDAATAPRQGGKYGR
jgi:hypothetical protein